MRASQQARTICFGKLPIAGDFLRGDGAAPEFRELDDWIQHGMYDSQQRVGADWQAAFDALPRARFVWTENKPKGAVIAGFWQASQDAVGRRYPFLLAVRLTKVDAVDVAAVPFVLTDWEPRASQLLDAGFAGHDVVGAIDAAQSLPCEPDWTAARARRDAALRQRAAADAWHGHAGHPELLLHDLEQVANQATPPGYGLRWPNKGDAADISFWLSALHRFGGGSPRLLLWDDQVARAALCPLQPKLFTGIAFATRDDDDAYDMGRGGAEDTRTATARARFAASVQASDQAAALAALPQGGR
ncbi:MAG: type VI secretion system-associated protein TagF [Planctomycetes bacterium]|nr:type VI secretion system-associated protein TagF [Planctomycetota bacterium]